MNPPMKNLKPRKNFRFLTHTKRPCIHCRYVKVGTDICTCLRSPLYYMSFERARNATCERWAAKTQ